MEAVDTILEELCRFGLRRREPILAVGGGVLLDIVGMAASLYRRGVPFVRVPTTLLALVDASVGVKNGVDYCSCSMGPQKNRVGTFYAPVGAFLDKSFIATQVRVRDDQCRRTQQQPSFVQGARGCIAMYYQQRNGWVIWRRTECRFFFFQPSESVVYL